MASAALVPLALVFVLLSAVVALWVGSLFDPRLRNVLYKLRLIGIGITHMLFSTDRRWDPEKFPDSKGLEVVEERRLVFIRHAESAWNVVANKGFGRDFPGRLRDALVKEGELIATLDSVFMDSPLSEIGASQAQALQKFVETGETELSEVLRGNEGDSVLVASNLRRGLSTLTIGMWERLKRTQEKILVLSSLQEITFNVDGVALAKPGQPPQLSDTEMSAIYGNGGKSEASAAFDPDHYFDCSLNGGNKAVFATGIERMQQFCDWSFGQKAGTIIVGGHSLYFRSFLKTFLPKDSKHLSKTAKMQNCAVLALTLQKGTKNNETWYSIDEDSIEMVYLNYEEKKKKR